MFDISFGQLLLVLVIGLVVLGPERLPVAIRTVAGWIKVLRRMSATVQLELNKELKLQELQDSLKKAEENGLKDIAPEIQESINDLRRVTDSLQQEINSSTTEIENSVNTVHSAAHDSLVTNSTPTQTVTNLDKDKS